MKQFSAFFRLVTCFSFLLPSCQTVVDLDLPEKKPLLVVNCFFNPDSSFAASVSKSQYILDNGGITKINNATVTLFEESVKIENLNLTGDGEYRSPGNFKPQAGKNYKLVVQASGFNQVEAIDAAPPGTEIISVDTGNFFFENKKYFELKVRFKDNPAEKNFYQLQLFGNIVFFVFDTSGIQVIDTVSFFEPLGFESRDFIFDDQGWFGNSGAMFSDELFGAKGEYQVSIFINTIPEEYDPKGGAYSFDALGVSLKSVSESYYRYLVSFQKYQTTNGSPFSEPVQVYNNIEKGYGIFAGYCGTQYVVTLK